MYDVLINTSADNHATGHGDDADDADDADDLDDSSDRVVATAVDGGQSAAAALAAACVAGATAGGGGGGAAAPRSIGQTPTQAASVKVTPVDGTTASLLSHMASAGEFSEQKHTTTFPRVQGSKGEHVEAWELKHGDEIDLMLGDSDGWLVDSAAPERLAAAVVTVHKAVGALKKDLDWHASSYGHSYVTANHSTMRICGGVRGKKGAEVRPYVYKVGGMVNLVCPTHSRSRTGTKKKPEPRKSDTINDAFRGFRPLDDLSEAQQTIVPTLHMQGHLFAEGTKGVPDVSRTSISIVEKACRKCVKVS